MNSTATATTVQSSSALVSVFAGKIGGRDTQLCNARDLHSFMEVGRDFSTWITDRVTEYGFVENEDFVIDSPKRGNQKGRGGDRRSKEYHLTIDMGKELAMVERNEKGRQVRRYFIECERVVLNHPDFRPEKTRKALPGALTIEQQDAIKQLVKAKAEQYPQERRGVATIKLWSALKSKFGVGYKDIPAEHFTDALSLVARLEPLEGECLPREDAATERNLAALKMTEAYVKDNRFLLSFDHRGMMVLQEVPRDACVMTLPQLLKAINEPNGLMVETELLAEFAAATIQRLARRADSQKKSATATA